MEKLKVLVVDDSVVYRKILVTAVESTGLGLVEHVASNGAIALERLAQDTVDVVLLDQFMPELTGLETLSIIKRDYPEIAVIIISETGMDSAVNTVTALKMGAIDFILKPAEASPDRNMEIIQNHLYLLFTQIKVKRYMAGVLENTKYLGLLGNNQEIAAINEKKNEQKLKKAFNGVDLILIAASTGGPAALELLFEVFPDGVRQPVLVIQHMPPEFTKVLAESLDKKCPLRVVEGRAGVPLSPGEITIAPGGFHMTVQAKDFLPNVIGLEDTPFVNGVRPAADVLFESVATVYENRNILVVVLTGMGVDGTLGIRKIKQKCNCYCITQSEETCIVYGMPKSVCDAGLSDEVVNLGDISGRIRQIVMGRC